MVFFPDLRYPVGLLSLFPAMLSKLRIVHMVSKIKPILLLESFGFAGKYLASPYEKLPTTYNKVVRV